jgi:hypothetical protein
MAHYLDHAGPIFPYRPEGGEIAAWFKQEAYARRFENAGGDAILLWQGESLYPYGTLHRVAEVDHDDQWFALLDVGCSEAEGERALHDLLFVSCGLREPLTCEWRGTPSDRQPWDMGGLIWFAIQIDSAERRQHFAWRNPSPAARQSPGSPVSQPGQQGNPAAPNPATTGGET